MKKMLILALIALFYIVSSAMVPPQTVPVDNDVGYSLIANQNTSIVIILPVQSPVIAGDVNYILDRGVSVPYRGLINQDIITFNDSESFEYNLYYTIDELDLKFPTLTGFEDQPDKYPFASDLGLRHS